MTRTLPTHLVCMVCGRPPFSHTITEMETCIARWEAAP
jgi:hypothetical protein